MTVPIGPVRALGAIPGDPAAIRAQAQALLDAARAGQAAPDALAEGRGIIRSGWTGQAAEAFNDAAMRIKSRLETLLELGPEAAPPLFRYADALEIAQRRYESAAARLDAAMNTASAASSCAAPEYQSALQAASQAEADMNDAWAAATAANEQAAAEVRDLAVFNPLPEMWSATKGLVNPSTYLGGVGVPVLGVNLGLIGLSGFTTWANYVKYGRFAPGARHGRFLPFKGILNRPWYARLRLFPAMFRERNWIAKPYQAATRSKFLNLAKVGTRASGALAVGTAFWEQWSRDSRRADLNTSERVGRAATRGAVEGGGAVVGAMAGAKAGAAIGTLVGGPVGTVVGGVIGGIAGGIVGSSVGDEIADELVDVGGDLADAIGDTFSSVF